MRSQREFVMSARPPPPVKEGDELEVKIEGVGSQGDGIARVKGFVLFVPGAKLDETIRIKVTKVGRNVGFADKLE
jgi:23S rRNA (uridine2552-2'-O)-methyltransferase